VHSRKEKSCNKSEMINEEAKLGLIARPMGRSVESESEEQHIRRSRKGSYRKICAGQKAPNKSEFK
jgi:hypothetical protein